MSHPQAMQRNLHIHIKKPLKSVLVSLSLCHRLLSDRRQFLHLTLKATSSLAHSSANHTRPALLSYSQPWVPAPVHLSLLATLARCSLPDSSSALVTGLIPRCRPCLSQTSASRLSLGKASVFCHLDTSTVSFASDPSLFLAIWHFAILTFPFKTCDLKSEVLACVLPVVIEEFSPRCEGSACEWVNEVPPLLWSVVNLYPKKVLTAALCVQPLPHAPEPLSQRRKETPLFV